MADKKINIDLVIETADAADSVNDIRKSIEELDKVGSKLDAGSDEFAKLDKKSKDLKKSLDDVGNGLKDAGKDSKKGLGIMKKGFEGVGSAMKATPIGAIIAAFVILKEVLEKQQPVLDLVDTAFTAIQLVISAVSNALKTAYDRITETTDSFDALGTVFSNVGTIIKEMVSLVLVPFKLTLINLELTFAALKLAWAEVFGNDEDVKQAKQDVIDVTEEYGKLKDSIADSVNNIGTAAKAVAENAGEAFDELKEGAKIIGEELGKIDAAELLSEAARTTALKKNAALASSINAGKIEEFDRLAEKEKQIADDVEVSIEDRIIANNKLKQILEEKAIVLQKNADISLAAAQATAKASGLAEDQVAVQDALNEKLAIANTIEGQNSEQKVRGTALSIEATAIEQTAIDGSIERATTKRNLLVDAEADETRRIAILRSNLQIEKDIELDRLNDIKNKTREGTQARADANEAILNAKLGFTIREAEIEKAAADNKLQIELTAKEEEEARKLENKEKVDEVAQIASDAEATLSELSNAKAEADRTRIDDTLSTELGAIDSKYSAALAAAEGDEEATKKILLKKGKEEFKAKLKAFNDTEKVNKATFENDKKLKLGMAVVDAAKAVITSLAAAPPVLVTVPNVAGIAALAMIAATSAATISKIKSSKYKGGASPTPAPVMNIPTSSPEEPTSIDTPVGNLETDDETIGGELGINQQNPIMRSVVLESDITDTQNRLLNYQEQSELG